MKTIILHLEYKTAWIKTDDKEAHKISKEILAWYLQHHTLKKTWEGKDTIWFEITTKSGQQQEWPATRKT